jgi:hypothetical protein
LVGSLKWFCKELVCEQSPAFCPKGKPGRQNWAFCSMAFVWDVCQFLLTTSFSKVVECVFFMIVSGPAHPYTGWISSVFCLISTRQRSNIPSIYLAISFVQLCWIMSFPIEQTMCSPVSVAVTSVESGQLHDGAGRQES